MPRTVRIIIALLALPVATHGATGTEKLKLPPFPLPTLALKSGMTMEISPTRLLDELFRSGMHGFENLETMDSDYALLRRDSLGLLAAWLEAVCQAVGFNLSQARTQPYDGTVLARLLMVATGLAGLQHDGPGLAMPIGTLVCTRHAAWGALPGDGATDAYVIFATEAGIIVYDPPTRQLATLADFPNREWISRVRF